MIMIDTLMVGEIYSKYAHRHFLILDEFCLKLRRRLVLCSELWIFNTWETSDSSGRVPTKSYIYDSKYVKSDTKNTITVVGIIVYFTPLQVLWYM